VDIGLPWKIKKPQLLVSNYARHTSRYDKDEDLAEEFNASIIGQEVLACPDVVE